MTIEQIKTLINGLKLSTLSALKLAQEAKDDASDALSISEQAQSSVSAKMDILNPVGEGSFSIGRREGSVTGEESFAAGRGVTASGSYSHAEGAVTTASGTGSHAECHLTEAIGAYSHAEGNNARASGPHSHAEGYKSVAEGDSSHAEGSQTYAYGSDSHAEGGETDSEGYTSHAEGFRTTAKGAHSHAEGHYTRAMGEDQHTQGRYNVEDTADQYAHIVGNGDSLDMRSNAHTLDWEGNAWFQGDVLVGSTSGTNKDDGSVRLAKVNEVIPAPTKAEVGQTVVVSAVDENGVPTAWEATTPSAVQLITWEGGD